VLGCWEPKNRSRHAAVRSLKRKNIGRNIIYIYTVFIQYTVSWLQYDWYDLSPGLQEQIACCYDLVNRHSHGKSLGDSILAFPMVAICGYHLSSQVSKWGYPKKIGWWMLKTLPHPHRIGASFLWAIATSHDEFPVFQLGSTLVPCTALHIHCLARLRLDCGSVVPLSWQLGSWSQGYHQSVLIISLAQKKEKSLLLLICSY